MKNTFKKHNSETSSNKTAPEKSKALDTGPERIAKAIARSGLCSRREAERWIINGQVKRIEYGNVIVDIGGEEFAHICRYNHVKFNIKHMSYAFSVLE